MLFYYSIQLDKHTKRERERKEERDYWWLIRHRNPYRSVCQFEIVWMRQKFVCYRLFECKKEKRGMQEEWNFANERYRDGYEKCNIMQNFKDF